ncbi:hypothetical protein HDU87_006628 [Geranomyces variabilis]|uniref:HIT-type domain-containing protein n=1 Tax=Geranomyces variabilis TaxID=109894 RepID=A0AAD5TGI7_9FUNG|nr:hypothetical protein HDU87_006628 [Geranomyces variabilis]
MSDPSCQVCSLNEHKYKCPGCGVQSCSLDCSKAHKLNTGCSGQRSKTHYIKLSEFTPNDMTSDYVLLEDAYRTADNAARDNKRLPQPSSNNPHQRLTPRQSLLSRQCTYNGTTLRFMPKGMKRREQNQSMYVTRSRFIFWTVELLFPECPGGEGGGAGVSLLCNRAKDKATVRALLAAELEQKEGNALTRHSVKPYIDAGIDALYVYLRKEAVPANTPTYVSLNLDQTLKSALFRQTVIEYPTLVIHTAPPLDVVIVDCEPPPTTKLVVIPDSIEGVHDTGAVAATEGIMMPVDGDDSDDDVGGGEEPATMDAGDQAAGE